MLLFEIFFSDIGVAVINFFSITTLAASHKFWDTVFIFIQCKILQKFPHDFFPLTHKLFRNMLFNFQIFGDFQNLFLLWLSHSVVVRKHTFHDFNIFKFETCVAAQHRSIPKNVSYVLDKICHFCNCWIECFISISLVDSVVHYCYIFIDFLCSGGR